MNLIYEIADRVYHASAGELAGATLMFGVGVCAGAAGLAMWLTAAACEGEGDEHFDDETASKATEPECANDVCAWCYPEQPHMKARDICPHHKRDMAEQARECAARNGGVL